MQQIVQFVLLHPIHWIVIYLMPACHHAYTELFTSERVLGSWKASPLSVLFFGMNSAKTRKQQYLFPLPLKATTNTGRNKSPWTAIQSDFKTVIDKQMNIISASPLCWVSTCNRIPRRPLLTWKTASAFTVCAPLSDFLDFSSRSY